VRLIACVVALVAVLLASSAWSAEANQLLIDEARFVSLGGIDQWITIRGRKSDASVMLWVHGGPADVQSPLVSVYEPWSQQFTLVQWDQRGAGKTFGKNAGPASEVSLDRIAQDGIELVEHLRQHLRVSKIVLSGHSWGTVVGLRMLQKRPELFEAFIGAGQVSSWRETVRWQYEYALRKARDANDAVIVQELEAAGLPPHDDLPKYFAMRRRLSRYFPSVDKEWLQREQQLYVSEPGASAADLKTYSAGGTFSGPQLMPTIVNTDLYKDVLSIPVRLCIIQGEHDTFTPTDLARIFFDGVHAPVKHFASIKGAGHFAPMTHAGEFLHEVVRCLDR
jgi:proline iminopeptidase